MRASGAACMPRHCILHEGGMDDEVFLLLAGPSVRRDMDPDRRWHSSLTSKAMNNATFHSIVSTSQHQSTSDVGTLLSSPLLDVATDDDHEQGRA